MTVLLYLLYPVTELLYLTTVEAAHQASNPISGLILLLWDPYMIDDHTDTIYKANGGYHPR